MTGVVIARAPLRISLGGGGTDQPSFYRKSYGEWAAAAIDKYVYVAVHESFEGDWRLRYSKQETVRSVDEIEHPILREALYGWKGAPLEVTSFADVPAGTGLGSSGAFTVALVAALTSLRRGFPSVTLADIAEKAFEVERASGMPVGKQDPYAATFGGVQRYVCDDKGVVSRTPVFPYDLVSMGMMLFFTGVTRSAETLLRDQESRHRDVRDRLVGARSRGAMMVKAIERDDIGWYGELLNDHWSEKRERSPGMSNIRVDFLRDVALDAGAEGVKLVGAGGGGFLLVAVQPDKRDVVRERLARVKAHELPFKLASGVEVL